MKSHGETQKPSRKMKPKAISWCLYTYYLNGKNHTSLPTRSEGSYGMIPWLYGILLLDSLVLPYLCFVIPDLPALSTASVAFIPTRWGILDMRPMRYLSCVIQCVLYISHIRSSILCKTLIWVLSLRFFPLRTDISGLFTCANNLSWPSYCSRGGEPNLILRSF